MKSFFVKYKKIVLSLSIFLGVLVGTGLYAFSHLEDSIAFLSKKFLGEELKVEKVHMSKKEIRIEGISMDIEGEKFIRIPELRAERKSLLSLGDIRIPEGDIYIFRRDKGLLLEKLIPKDQEKKEEKEYQPVTNVPIERIIFQNIRTHYIDRAIEPEFQKTIVSEGELLFDKEKGISGNLLGKDGEEEYKLRYSGEKYPYDVQIQTSPLELRSYQQAYAKGSEDYLDLGKAEINLSINPDGMDGKAKLEVPKLHFASKQWDEGKIQLDFQGKDIFLDYSYREKQEKKDLKMVYLLEDSMLSAELEDLYYDKIRLGLEKKEKWNLSFLAESDIYPELHGDLALDWKEQNLNLSLESNVLSAEAAYDSEKKELHIFQEEKFDLFYDVKKQSLLSGEGVIPFHLYDYDANLEFTAKDDVLSISQLHVQAEEKGSFDVEGKIDIKQKEVDLDYRTEHFVWEHRFGEDDFLTELALRGKISYTEKQGLEISSQGELEKISYGDYELEGFRTDVEYKKEKLEVYSLENRFLYAKGSIDTKDWTGDIPFEIKDYAGEGLNLTYPKFFVNKAKGRIFGDLRKPDGELFIEEGKISLLERKESQVRGNFTMKEGKISSDNVELDQSRASGWFSILDQTYQAKINVIEERFSDYYGFYDLVYRLIGEVNLEGKGRELTAKAKSTIDKVHYQGRKLPNIAWEGIYNLGKEGLGQVYLSPVKVQNSAKKTLLTLEGEIDLDREWMKARLEKQAFSLKDIEEYSGFDFLEGEIQAEGKLEGNYSNPDYQLRLFGKNLKVKEAPLDDFLLVVKGNGKALELEKFGISYLNNLLEAKGYYRFDGEDYHLTAHSSKIDWSLLQAFAEQYGVKGLRGNSTLQLELKPAASRGSFQLENFHFNMPEQHLDFKDFHGNIKIVDKDIRIESILGKINEGRTELKGRVELPKLPDIDPQLHFLKALDYSLSLDMDEVNYDIPKVMDLDISSHLRLERNKMRGNVEILRGEVWDVPNEYQSYWQILKKFFEKKVDTKVVLESQKLGEDFALKSTLQELFDVNVSLLTRENIKIQIPELNVAVEEVRGLVSAALNLSGKEGKYSIMGNAEVQKGSLMVNSNTFVLNKALVSFNDSKLYLPEINPNLNVESTVDVNGDKVRFNLQGKVKDLRFSVSSREGSTSGSLNSLLSGDIETSGNNASYTALLRNLIGGQLTQFVIRPFVKTVRNVFRFEKFRISSNIYNEQDDKGDSDGNLYFGAKLEVEDNLYQDKLYWNFTGDLYGIGTNLERGAQKEKSRILDSYDFTIRYPYSETKSFEVGAGKLPSKFYIGKEDRSSRKINYHVGFRFEKKMDSFWDIFQE